jgi:hypothetical protein
LYQILGGGRMAMDERTKKKTCISQSQLARVILKNGREEMTFIQRSVQLCTDNLVEKLKFKSWAVSLIQ